MGLGIGVDCDLCNKQLDYERDCEEICEYTLIDESGEQRVTKRPVMCHKCKITVKMYLAFLSADS